MIYLLLPAMFIIGLYVGIKIARLPSFREAGLPGTNASKDFIQKAYTLGTENGIAYGHDNDLFRFEKQFTRDMESLHAQLPRVS